MQNLSKCSVKHPGWTVVQRDVKFGYDLENFPLEIRTRSEIGSDKQMRISFYSAMEDYAGGGDIFFTSPPQCFLGHCNEESRIDFPTALPFGKGKVWRISLTRDSGVPRLVVWCNNKEILNLEITDTKCTDSRWGTTWSRDVEKIMFPSEDTASEYYRAGK